jgi:hypothetical protein
MAGQFRKSLDLWEKWKGAYPYHCRTTTGVKPSSIEVSEFGNHVSVVLEQGVRVWGFNSILGYIRFIRQYKNSMVKKSAHD